MADRNSYPGAILDEAAGAIEALTRQSAMPSKPAVLPYLLDLPDLFLALDRSLVWLCVRLG